MRYFDGTIRNSHFYYVVDVENNTLLDSFSEVHATRSWSLEEVNGSLKNNGFESCAFYDEDSGGTVRRKSQRVINVSRVAK
ncbi:MAG TPA: hypothetical protein VFF30_11560 [Nitrososphaerales archaeon]|nr:hypothetical protein [Nitrososphaerales archaeon]